MIATSYHDTVNVLQAPGFESASPFGRPEWFALLAGEGGLPALIAMARQDDQAAALPLMRDGNALTSLANWYSFTWQPLLTAEAASEELFTAIARDLKKKEKRITLHALPDEDGTASMLARAFRAAGWWVIREEYDSNHILVVERRTYQDYLAGRHGSLRTTLKRKAKKVEIEIHTAFDANAWDEYETVYANSWKPAEGRPAMLRAFAKQEGAAGRLRLGIARHEGRAIAAQFWTVEMGTAYIHKLAHVKEAEPLSAGTVLTSALFEHVIDVDLVALIDFGTGDDPYKSMWMDTKRPRYRLDCHLPGNPASWRYFVKAGLRKLASSRHAG